LDAISPKELHKKITVAGLPWERSKAFEGSAVFSHFVDAPSSLTDLKLELYIDGELRQRGGPRKMLYTPSIILEVLRSFIPLEDGDIVMTGRASGVGPVEKDALFEARLLYARTKLVGASCRAI